MTFENKLLPRATMFADTLVRLKSGEEATLDMSQIEWLAGMISDITTILRTDKYLNESQEIRDIFEINEPKDTQKMTLDKSIGSFPVRVKRR